MLLKAETAIGPEENAVQLGERLSYMGADLLVRTLEGLARGTVLPEPQEASQATYAPMLKKEDGLIDWSLPADVIHNRVRGLQPWPGAFTRFRGHTLHIWKSRVVSPGARRDRGLFADCGGGSVLELLEVQLEGRKRIPADAFAHGQRLEHQLLAG
jgi:methionyl-tRNA formyltransferase